MASNGMTMIMVCGETVVVVVDVRTMMFMTLAGTHSQKV